MTVGYTPKQAQRLKDQLDLGLARIEDIVYRMRHRVSDIGYQNAPDQILEDLREWKYGLDEVIDRRTRS